MAADPWFPTPVWWVDAARCGIDLIRTGAHAGDGEVTSEAALVLSGDSSYAIEGTRDELREFVARLVMAAWDLQEWQRPEVEA